MFRQHLEEMMGEHKLSVKLDAPEELVEDPTYELRRMQYKVRKITAYHFSPIFSLFFLLMILFLCSLREILQYHYISWNTLGFRIK